tara:strand:- start:763 stop:993 length:231 start_codon:yes stop_codon:yes gene_type:complete
MLSENHTYEDELNHQRRQNLIYTKEKIIMFKLIDLKQNLYFSGGLKYHDHMLNKVKNNLIKYEKDLIKYKKYNRRY